MSPALSAAAFVKFFGASYRFKTCFELVRLRFALRNYAATNARLKGATTASS
jgi:hypothetical protein